jgi:phosphoenolpyruvate carboxykinase (ATP)
MDVLDSLRSSFGLDHYGLHDLGNVTWNAPVPALYEEAIRRRECVLAEHGAMVVSTGAHTGRSPQDKYIVDEETSRDRIWWGPVNRPMSPEAFASLHRRIIEHFRGRDVFVQDCVVGADHRYRLPIRVVTSTAWHSLFARTMFVPQRQEELASHVPEFTVLHAPDCLAIPEHDGTRSETFIVINFARRLVLIGGTAYAGEIKKAVFSVLNYLLPLNGVLSMHCSASAGPEDDVAIFFGLSGTGKTTLSSDRSRRLIGDDEHGWTDQGVFNFEGGCYAKVIRLSAEAEPEIYQAVQRFGAILENVTLEPRTRVIDFNDDSRTENTRAAYPLTYIDHADPRGIGQHPRHIFMLTADAFGVLPPLARLTHEQAMYHFLSGYTAKVAGTERGVSEPAATFSACFGAPFLTLPPHVYARMLGERMAAHRAQVWLVNTGWTGGPYGVGHRMPIAVTRAMIRAVLSGALDDVPTERDPVFGFAVPVVCPGVPSDLLRPRATWPDPVAYDRQAARLAAMFAENFDQFVSYVPDDVRSAGPTVRVTIG